MNKTRLSCNLVNHKQKYVSSRVPINVSNPTVVRDRDYRAYFPSDWMLSIYVLCYSNILNLLKTEVGIACGVKAVKPLYSL